MKKLILLHLFLASAAIAGATERIDTLINVAGVDTVMVIDHKSHSTLSFHGVNDGIEPRGVNCFDTRVSMPNHRGETSVKTSSINIHFGNDLVMGGVCLGGISAFNLPTQFGKSIEVGWLNTIGYSWTSGRSRFSFGLGLNWRNYRMTGGDLRWAVDPQGNAVVSSLAQGEVLRFSRLKTFSLTIPMIWKLNMPFRLCATRQSLSLGAELNFMTHASVLTQLTDADGVSHKFSNSDINYKTVSANLVSVVELSSGFGLYVRYSPFKILETPSPQFTSLSTGLIILY